MFMQIKNEARKNTEREVEGALNDAELNLIEDTIFKEREKAKSRFYNAIERTKYDVIWIK